MKTIKFIPFYFEGNQRWGQFNTPEDVKDLLRYYDYATLRKAKSYNDFRDTAPSFGFYHEYNGSVTFGEWIDKNNLGIFFDIKLERKLKLKEIDGI